MNPWFARAAVIAATIVMIAIRAPHGQRSRSVPVKRNARGALETGLLTVAWLGFFLPLVWLVSPLLDFAEYTLHPVPYAVGVVTLAVGLYLFHRSHADLGTNWSLTLEVRENHRLVTAGIYRHVRHPMYLALLVYSVGQALVVPNWIAGPSYGVAMGFLFAFRLGPEERMMVEEFGKDYEAYMGQTKRLVPGVW